MTPEVLQRYYDMQLDGVRMYFDLTTEQRSNIMSLAEGFEADLPYLDTKGIDTSAARLVFNRLNAIK